MIANKDLRGNDIIDSRDVIARIDYITSMRDAALEAAQDPEHAETVWKSEDGSKYADPDGTGYDIDEDEEYRALLRLQSEAEGSPDWIHGEGLIRDSYFTEYAQELADDIGATDPYAQWPTSCIDWEQAADALKQDYMSVDFDGEEYWIRA